MKKSIIKVPKNFFEKKAWADSLYVCGMDEVGRGCLAGPVLVAAVILPLNCCCLFKDSKILSADEREKDCRWITKNAFWATALVDNVIIDKVNIYQATLLAMHQAYMKLLKKIPFPFAQLKYLIIDAMPVTLESSAMHKDLEVYHFPFGESVSTTIAAASIVAKVTRDHLMADLEVQFPVFSFAQHKGYGTKRHWQELEAHGPTSIHRKSFLKSLKQGGSNDEFQQSLF